jgi:hypothetical protein
MMDLHRLIPHINKELRLDKTTMSPNTVIFLTSLPQPTSRGYTGFYALT